MGDIITRAQYMAESARLHHAYYLQFAGPGTYALVRDKIGVARIKASADPHLNDIPLPRWDALDGAIRATIRKDVKRRADGRETGYLWSLLDTVCCAKAVARDIAFTGT